MSDLIRIEGTGKPASPQKKGFTIKNYDPAELTAGHMDLLIARDHYVAKRDNFRKIKGIGSLHAEKANNTVDVLTDALDVLDNEKDTVAHMGAIAEDIENRVYSNHHQMAGIGNAENIAIGRSKKAQARKEKRQEKVKQRKESGQDIKSKTGKFLKNAADKAKKGVKALAKVATAPQKFLAKQILETILPQVAPLFLYLFINDPTLIAKLPGKVKAKRSKVEKIKNFIVNTLGMKEAHFMGIVRNGIMKKMGASPESIIAGQLKGIAGVGFVTDLVKLVPIIIKMISKLVEMFGKKSGENLSLDAKDVSDADDFADLSAKEKEALARDVKAQNDDPDKGDEEENDADSNEKQADNNYKSGGSKPHSSLG